MKKHLTAEDLSAYIDNEGANREDMTRHLQQCAECAREHVALSKLSAHLRALPAPDVHPAFAGHVLHALEEDVAPVRPRLWPVPGAIAMAAVVILFAAYLRYPYDQGPTGKVPSEIAVNTPDAATLALAELERRIYGGAESDDLLDDVLFQSFDTAETYEEDLLNVLANSAWFESFAEEWSDVPGAVDAVYDLDREETQVFLALLTEYADEE